MIPNTSNGVPAANNTATVAEIHPPSPAAIEIAMLLALQKKEWQELRSTAGVILQYINLTEPTSGRNVLLIAIGTKEDDIVGNNATLDIEINAIGIDAIVESVVLEKKP